MGPCPHSLKWKFVYQRERGQKFRKFGVMCMWSSGCHGKPTDSLYLIYPTKQQRLLPLESGFLLGIISKAAGIRCFWASHCMYVRITIGPLRALRCLDYTWAWLALLVGLFATFTFTLVYLILYYKHAAYNFSIDTWFFYVCSGVSSMSFE